MKPILSVTIFFAAVLCIPACKSPDEQKPQHAIIDTVAIQKSIDSLGAVVQKAHETKDNRLMGSTWAKDGIFTMSGAPPVRGREAIVNALLSMPPLPPGGTMTIHPIEVQVLSSEWAYIFGIDSLKYTPPGEAQPVNETFAFFGLVRKTSEGWQTYREILSPNQLPDGPKK